MGHTLPGGRWGNPHKTKKVRPRIVKNKWGILRTFFRWSIKQDLLDISPLDHIDAPVAHSEAPGNFSHSNIEALLRAADRSVNRYKNRLALLLLFDTGMRASELCNLRLRDVDLNTRSCTVLGKGNKRRQVFFGRDTVRAFWQYLSERFETREQAQAADEYVFLSDRGALTGEPMTRSGLLQLFQRLGKAAGLQGVRCSPHTMRHTFAVEFLRNGGNVFSLQQILGHTDLKMTERYVALAEADIENQAGLYEKFQSAPPLAAGMNGQV
jgi:site-specific recombinase XerD